MKITNKVFSLPPYISTGWENVNAMHMRGSLLLVILKDGDTISIPNLEKEAIELIFKGHAEFLENLQQNQTIANHPPRPFGQLFMGVHPSQKIDETGLQFGLNTLDSFGTALQHNPAQASIPDLPTEVLSKISAISKILAPDDLNAIPKAEPHCNCVHCQIAKAIHHGIDIEEEHICVEHEDVNDTDLQFQQWDINQTGDKLFTVVNRLDSKEKYSVYLGHPVGCTCGKEGCEHVVAVLKS